MRVAPPKCYAILIVDNGAEINCVIGHHLRHPTSHPIFTRSSALSNKQSLLFAGTGCFATIAHDLPVHTSQTLERFPGKLRLVKYRNSVLVNV